MWSVNGKKEGSGMVDFPPMTARIIMQGVASIDFVCSSGPKIVLSREPH
jgi:hypothetical protein